MSWIYCFKEGSKIKIRVQPRSSKSAVSAIHDDRLKIYVLSPPVDEMANKECVRLLAKILHIARSDFEITSGKTGRNKTIKVVGADADFIKKKIMDHISN